MMFVVIKTSAISNHRCLICGGFVDVEGESSCELPVMWSRGGSHESIPYERISQFTQASVHLAKSHVP